MNAHDAYHTTLETIIQEIHSIYARWRNGETSQEDALFEIGDSLEKMGLLPPDASGATAQDPE